MIFVQKPDSYDNFMSNIVTLFDGVDQLKRENSVLNLVFDQFISLIVSSTKKRQPLRNSLPKNQLSWKLFADPKISDSPINFNPKISDGPVHKRADYPLGKEITRDNRLFERHNTYEAVGSSLSEDS